MFNVNYDEASQGQGIMPEGEYECIIKSAIEDVAKSGTKLINIPLIVRNDVSQDYKNAYIWHKIWQLKQPKDADKACGGYSNVGIQTLSKTANLQNGKKYKNLEEWLNELKGKTIRVAIKHEEFNGKTQIKVNSLAKTKYPNCNHVYKENSNKDNTNNSNFDDANFNDKDCPF